MTWTSTLALCAASSAIVAVPLLIRLSAVNAQRDLYRTWWERDSGKMIVAQAEIDLIREQRREAGRQSHKVERALFRETADKIASLPAQPLRPRHEIEAEVAAIRAARKAIKPTAANPALGFPADLSAGRKMSGRRQASPHSGQDTGAGILPDVTQRASDRTPPVDTCRRNRAGHSAPAETPEAKGASYG